MNKNCLELKGNGCSLDYFEKNAYFHGKLMTARDMLAEQKMHEAKLYTVNRFVLGDGLICGLETDKLRVDNGKLMVNINPGIGIDCCGRLVVVKGTGAVVTKEVKQIEEESGADYPEPMYLYVRYKECLKEAVPITGVEDACEEKCCYNHILEVFDVVYSTNPPGLSMPPDVNFPSKSEYDSDKKKALLKIAQDYYSQYLKSGCNDCTEHLIFLGVFKIDGEDKWELDETTKDYLKVGYTNKMLYDIIASHATNFGNPHEVTAEQVGALVSIDGVRNDGGDVDLIAKSGSAIEITPNDKNNSITIGENHSDDTENPHKVTAELAGALVSIDGVRNDGGDVDLIAESGSAIVITPDDGNNSITIGEKHSNDTENPHKVTAEQAGALVSIDGVHNDGGDVDLIAESGSAIVITPNDGNNSITIGEKHSNDIKNPHKVTAVQAGALASINSINNVHSNLDIVSSDGTISITNVNSDINLTLANALQDKISDLEDQVGSMQRYLMDKSLKYKLKAFSEVKERFGSMSAEKIVVLVKEALDNRIYTKPDEYLEVLKKMASVEKAVSEDIIKKVTEESYEKYMLSVKELAVAIRTGNVSMVAVAQDEVCEMAEWLESIEMIVVPDVVEIHIDQARKVIIGSGLAVGQVTEKFGDLEPGTVVDQYPKGGTEVSVGSSMDLAVVKESVSVWWKDSLRSYFYYDFRIGTPDTNFDYKADLSWWKDSLVNYFYKDMRIN
jgi:hypothetical protein